MKPQYLRFVTGLIDPDSGRRQGLFQAASMLEDNDEISGSDRAALDDIYRWFKRNLKAPARLTITRRPNAKAQAIGWFKASAAEHIAQMRAYATLLQEHGIVVHELRTDRPGIIVYEDDYQVAAYPFADTPC